MYSVTVSDSFVAQHFLTVPDPGPEGELHSHYFGVSAEFRGDSLGEYGYLVDIDAANRALSTVIDRYRDETLNELPEFEGLNPSVEHFARIVCDRFCEELSDDSPDEVTVRVREDDLAWASYRRAA